MVIEIKKSDTIGELAKGLGISEEQIEEAGLDSKFQIGQQKVNIAGYYRDARDVAEGKKKKRTTHGKPPTLEEVDKLKKLGISLEKKNKSKKELAEAAFPAITDPDLLDSEQQALDTLISKTEEKGGKNGQKQQS